MIIKFIHFWFPSDHALLTINIIIEKEFIQDRKHIIIENFEEECKFVNDFMRRFRNIDTSNIVDKKNSQKHSSRIC